MIILFESEKFNPPPLYYYYKLSDGYYFLIWPLFSLSTTIGIIQVNFQGLNCYRREESCREHAIHRTYAICQSCTNSTQCKLIACEYRCVCRDGYIFNENNNSCVQAISTTDSAMSSYEPSNENFANGTLSDNAECGENMEYNEISSFCHIPFVKSIYNFFNNDGCKVNCVCKKGYKKSGEGPCKLEASASYCSLIKKPCGSNGIYQLENVIVKNDVLCKIKCTRKKIFI
ncbi:unnamed protein product [Dracunculus medinensis]|uniref:TIL domain-containing protein n=1 Tax=Dracunculus medinensis TaxID=318479 RepID=A0A0N4UKC2_DRAME|nr:unnamed protein product [Dracunculus medinensis]